MFITLGILASFFDVFGNIITFLLVLSLVICIHELGHLFFAKRAGILCHEFSFGMGPKLWSTKKGETTYAIRAIPFGGFVSMAGEELDAEVVKVGQKIGLVLDENQNISKIVLNLNDQRYPEAIETVVESLDLSDSKNLNINDLKVNEKAMYVFKKGEMQIAPSNRRFNDKSKMERLLTTFGGPLMNFILAFVIFLVIAFSTGVANTDSTIIEKVEEDMPAYGILEDGDRIISINGVEVDSWEGTEHSIVTELRPDTGGYIFEVERNDTIITLDETVYPLLTFYGLGFAGDSSNDDLIVYGPLFINSELISGDEIVSINGQTMNTWDDLINFQDANSEGSENREDTFKLSIFRNIKFEYTSGIVDSIELNDGLYTVTISATNDEDETESVEYEVGSDISLLVDKGDTLSKDAVIASGPKDIDFIFYGQKELNAMGVEMLNSQIGITSTTKFSFFGGIAKTFTLFWGAATSIFGTLGLLFTSNLVGVSDLSGFVGIYSMTSQAAAYGFLTLFSFIALLSVNLGILNLLPIPALDGGRIVFLGYEAITNKKPNQKVENFMHTAVFFLLLALMIYVTYHDILRLFGF